MLIRTIKKSEIDTIKSKPDFDSTPPNDCYLINHINNKDYNENDFHCALRWPIQFARQKQVPTCMEKPFDCFAN